jgi:ribosome-associated protein
MKTIEFTLRGGSAASAEPFVSLCDLLKLTGVADSGGHGKALVASGAVSVDGHAESRKTAKIRAGQVVECGDTRIVVSAA